MADTPTIDLNGVVNLLPTSGQPASTTIPASTSIAVVSNISPNFIGYVNIGPEGTVADFTSSVAVLPGQQVALSVGTAVDLSVIGDGALFNITFGK